MGTNPLTFGIPTDEEFPFVIDCATSINQRYRVSSANYSRVCRSEGRLRSISVLELALRRGWSSILMEMKELIQMAFYWIWSRELALSVQWEELAMSWEGTRDMDGRLLSLDGWLT